MRDDFKWGVASTQQLTTPVGARVAWAAQSGKGHRSASLLLLLLLLFDFTAQVNE